MSQEPARWAGRDPLEQRAADLPGQGAVVAAPARAKEVARVWRAGGNVRYEGAWEVPKHLEIEVRGGCPAAARHTAGDGAAGRTGRMTGLFVDALRQGPRG